MEKSKFSLLLLLFFIFNIFSLSFVSGKISSGKSSSIEQIFSAVQNPINILSNKLDSETKNKTTQSKEENTNKKISSDEYILSNNLLNLSKDKNICVSGQLIYSSIYNFVKEGIYYPLKIPFLRCIFLLLILKLLFNVLPRSISVNYNIRNIEGACIV